jgi:predicted Zn-dependent peptidase
VLGTPAELAGVSLRSLREFYARTYRRGGAKIALVGNISRPARVAARGLLASLPDGYSAPVPLLGWKAFPGNSIVLATADLLNPVVVIGYKAPPGNSSDFAAMYVLETVFQSSLAYDSITTLADRGFGPFHIVYDYTVKPASMTVTVTSSGDAPMTADRTITALIDVLSSRQLDVEAINALKKLSIGRYVMQAADPEVEAQRILTLSNLGLGEHGGDDLVERIAAVTPADLQNVVRRYCNNVTLARVAPRNESAP